MIFIEVARTLKNNYLKITDMNKAKNKAILWLLLAVVYFLIFAWDIENDIDLWTWLWLLNSIVCFLVSMLNWIVADRK